MATARRKRSLRPPRPTAIHRRRGGTEEMTRDVADGYEALSAFLGRVIQRVKVIQCRITVKFSIDSSTIVVHFPPKYIRGPATKSSTIFILLPQKWQPNPAEPEVQAVPPHRHPPSARKLRLHPLLRLSPAAPCCPLLVGSIRCPTISGFIKSCTHFWT